MATMYPSLSGEDIKSHIGEDSEIFIYKKLSRLGEGFHIFHSIRYVDFTYSSNKPEGESDFVILHKDLGLLIFEVKGGDISCNDGVWKTYNGSEKSTIRPYKQARENEHVIVNKKLEQERSVKTNFTYGYAVCFPDSDVPDFSKSLENSTLESKDITIGQNHLDSLESNIRNIMNRWGGKYPNNKVPESTFQEVVDVLRRRFNLTYSLRTKIESTKEHLIALDKEQTKFLSFLREHNHAAINGPAGSGKTILATEKCRRLADDGNEVLLLTYNKPISRKLSEELRDYPSIEVSNVHSWGLRIIRESGVGRSIQALHNNEPLGDEFFRIQFPQLLLEALQSTWLTYDSIIIDEGQDFEEDVLLSLQSIIDEKTHFYVFYDPNQDVYNTYESLDLPSPPYPLPYNYRNPREVVKFTSYETRFEVDPSPNRSDGKRPSKIEGRDVKIKKEINEDVSYLIKKGVKPSTICILSQNSDKFIEWWDQDEVGGISYQKSEIPSDPNSLRISSLKRFKGLECNYLLACNIQDVSSIIHDRQKYYVALTRAKMGANIYIC